jgi:hypothetical protein
MLIMLTDLGKDGISLLAEFAWFDLRNTGRALPSGALLCLYRHRPECWYAVRDAIAVPIRIGLGNPRLVLSFH